MANSISVEQAGQVNWVKWNGECLVLLQLQLAWRKRASLCLESFVFLMMGFGLVWLGFRLPPCIAQNGDGLRSGYLIVRQSVLPLGSGVYSRCTGLLRIRQMGTSGHARGPFAALHSPGTCSTDPRHTLSKIGATADCGTPSFQRQIVHYSSKPI